MRSGDKCVQADNMATGERGIALYLGDCTTNYIAGLYKGKPRAKQIHAFQDRVFKNH